jgi:deoxyribodipyrimidine photolyase-related protein
MTILRLIMGDQLTRGIAALQDVGADDAILMVEVESEIAAVPHHKQKVVLVLSAMRHFARELQDEGLHVIYARLDDPDNAQNFTGEVARAIRKLGATRIIVTEAGEWRVAQEIASWPDRFGIPVEVRRDERFLVSREGFSRWAQKRQTLRMEYFYRDVRRKTGLLMRGADPEGGAWNFDQENRKPPPRELRVLPPKGFAPDAITREVMTLVAQRFPRHFGKMEDFAWAVNRAQAVEALTHFIKHRLPGFGDYQDAMARHDAFLFHSLLSPYLNLGLLGPLEVCRAVEMAWLSGEVPLNAAEGFIRQIIGWREYIRGVYWLKMPQYKDTNFFSGTRSLPDFYWTGSTPMACIASVVRQTQRHAYSHHIQRLMVTGNFALLAGLSPSEVERWYLAVFIDAFEWVELPNTHGMALFADGGLLASKPYAASGSYINRMSDYCKGCSFSPAIRTGEGACPFNYLYWNFLIENRKVLEGNARLKMVYRALDTMPADRREMIVRQAAVFLNALQDTPGT